MLKQGTKPLRPGVPLMCKDVVIMFVAQAARAPNHTKMEAGFIAACSLNICISRVGSNPEKSYKFYSAVRYARVLEFFERLPW